MSTVNLIVDPVHHIHVSVLAGQAADAGPAPLVAAATVAAILLLGAALKSLGRAIAPIGELIRAMLSAAAVAGLLVVAIALLLAALVISAGA